MHELAKVYDPGAIEARWAEAWVAKKLFEVRTPAPGSPEAARAFTLLLPPPNVTGRLHMGHMLNQTEMDIIIRWRRMSGDLAVWVPGTDHAGIATQMMVERQLATEKASRQALGREKFVERVWQWREHYGGEILRQMKRLGASVDWSREYFTMDEGLSRAVREVFVRLYEEGLIYRGKYIVNWCPRCQTAISNLEVTEQETAGKLYEIRYPVIGTKEFITVATTRPETMLGDTAVAVNAGDERYKHLHGKKVMLPLMEREIPIILDDLARPEFGTGAVKVTPAHDPNDFEAGLRHSLPQIDVMDDTAHMNENAGKYAGLDRYEARKKILEDLEAKGLLGSAKDHVIPLGRCQRCGTVVEPRLSTQWFVAVNKKVANKGNLSLARLATDVVLGQDPAIRFRPENYKTIYLNWMENIYDWCISRQLWWGHRIPAWHCADCQHINVARETLKTCEKCCKKNLTQDPDVLDTWFSSALLPFTAFGWPERTRDLEVFYPTSLLITGFDILFLWVSRMIMLGCWFNYDFKSGGRPEDFKRSVPFRDVYIHALVRDAERQKMSKTKGNVIDPLEVTEKYGTDAVRFTLASMASPGTDIAFNEEACDGSRRFANKIWNAARFIFQNVDRAEAAGVWHLREFQSKEVLGEKAEFKAERLEDRWIWSRFNRVAQQVNAALREYRFDQAADAVYHFFWDEFCDWYIEIVKLRLTAGQRSSDAEKETSRTAFMNLVVIFEGSLRMLSPFMPFLTEELWQVLHDGRPVKASVALARYPSGESATFDEKAESEMDALKQFIFTVRELRASGDVPPKEIVPVFMSGKETARNVVLQNKDVVKKLANLGEITIVSGERARHGLSRSTAMFDVALEYAKKVDAEAERERLNKELERMERERSNAISQLEDKRFLGRAPAEIVEGRKRRKAELDVLIEKTRQALESLTGQPAK